MSSNKIVIVMLAIAVVLAFLFYYELDFLRVDYDDRQYVLEGQDYQYNLKTPDDKYVMPSKLIEISGLGLYKQDKILCIQDEDGLLFQYDIKKRRLDHQLQFGKNRDYEGIAFVDDMVYVTDSDGDVFYFSYINNRIGEVKEVKTHLTSKNDTEGLGFDHHSNSLLIACKGSGDSKKYNVKGKGVYKIDLEDHKFIKEAFLHVDKDDLEDFLEQQNLNVRRHNQFSPSAIAVHPGNEGDIFILGTVGKLLLVFNKDKSFKNAIPLDPDIFRQPEGITFDERGTLYISSEGKGKDGYILKFENLH